MKYTIEVNGYGSEYAACVLPDTVWDYIQNECEGDVDTYWEKVSEGEVPDELKIAEEQSSIVDESNSLEKLFHSYGPYIDATITVEDEHGNEVWSGDANDIDGSYVDDCSFSGKDFKHYIVAESVESGLWKRYVVEAEKFDPKKLSAYLCRLDCEGGCTLVEGLSYDDEELEDEDCLCTDGKSNECCIYER